MANRRIGNVPDMYDAANFRKIIGDIDKRFQDVERKTGTYDVSNFVPTRSLDMATATPTDIGNFLATLVEDLQGAGRLG